MINDPTCRPPRKDFLVFGAPAIGRDEIESVVRCLESGWIGTGPLVARFQELFRSYNGGGPAAAVNSCTAALHLSMLAADLEPGSEVITTPLTFCSTVNAIIHAGLVPVLADIDPVTLNIDPVRVEERITDRTSAILPVHFAGRPCEMDALSGLAAKHDLVLIEDCAHAIETEYRGRKAGTFGDFGCFSFYVTKNVVTGEGGMVVSKNEELADRIKILALHGMDRDAWKRFSDSGYRHYDVVNVGYKYNMTDMQAAIGIPQLARIEANRRRREQIWAHYQQSFSSLPFQLPVAPAPYTRHALHLYTILIDSTDAGLSRDQLCAGLTELKIGTGVHYRSIPMHSVYQQRFGWRAEDYPASAYVGERILSLPLSPKLSDGDVEDVVASVKQVLRNSRRNHS